MNQKRDALPLWLGGAAAFGAVFGALIGYIAGGRPGILFSALVGLVFCALFGGVLELVLHFAARDEESGDPLRRL